MDGISVMVGKFLRKNKSDAPNKRDGRKLLRIIKRNLKETSDRIDYLGDKL